MKKILSLIVCSVCCGVAVAQTYSLQQLKDSALHNNIAIRNARHSVDAAQQQRKEAFTKYFPNISGTGLWFNANKGMAETSINPSEVIPSSLAPVMAQVLPAEALMALANPISISMMKNGTIAGGEDHRAILLAARLARGEDAYRGSGGGTAGRYCQGCRCGRTCWRSPAQRPVAGTATPERRRESEAETAERHLYRQASAHTVLWAVRYDLHRQRSRPL